MVAVNKKRICSELLHIALVITLLRGNDNNRYYRQTPVISTNFFNDVSVSNDIMGPSWAYSRTSFHHLYHDPPIHEIKTVDGHYTSDDILDLNSDAELTDEDYDIDLRIVNQLRILTLSRFNSLSRLRKNQPAFQDITAYLLSESTSPSNAVSTPVDVIEYDSAASASPEPSEVEMSGQETLVMSPGVDSGHEETGDDADANSTTSDNVKEFPLEVAASFSRNSQRRESNGFHSDSDEELAILESLSIVEETAEEGEQTDVKVKTEEMEMMEEEEAEDAFSALMSSVDVDPLSLEQRDVKIKTEEELVEEEIKAQAEKLEESELEELQWNEWLNDVPDEMSLQLSPLLPESAELDQNARELLEHVHLNEIGGAAGIDLGIQPPSSVSELLGLPQGDEHDGLSELMLEAERSSLEFYKKFNDITENELNNAIAPQNLHDFDEDGNEIFPSTSTASNAGESLENRRERDFVPSADVTPQDTQDIISAMLDDILDHDSGVFDIFDATSDRGDEVLSESSLPSLPEELNEDSRIEAEESIFSADMIQTAPIHASARPTAHAAQPRGFQVHARMPGLLRSGSVEQRWQDLANLLSLQSSTHDPSGAGIHQPIPHHFPPHPYHHHHHHHHHTPTPLHHSMHPPHFGSAVPPTTPYTTETARSVLLQNATLPPPELNTTSPYVNVGMGASSNLGSAVASSMHLTNSSEPMIDPGSHYKMMDPSHDMLYYQNSTNEMANQTTAADGFNLSSILNDDELQLMDMAMSEGMYSMRVMDNGVPPSNLTTVGAAAGSVVQGPPNPPPPPPSVSHNGTSSCTLLGASGGATATSSEDRMEASSDSAVSSMGSERVPPMTDPPMSDNEWVDADSHTHGPHDLSPYSMDYSRGKLGGYDYYKDGSRGGPVAQKKHHMFGKRFQQEQSSHPYPLPSHLYPSQHGNATQGSSLDLDKYSCSADFGRFNGQRSMDPTATNHTYALPPTHPENPLLKGSKPQAQKEKQKMIKYFKSDEALTRDEKKARAMSIPITTEDIINLPMDEFNERLSKYDLSETQLSLIRDIRRRGKNKVAAQNCRKRKLDQILQLADEVQRIREKKQALMREQEGLLTRRTDLKERYSLLYRTVFQALRDSEGNPYSPYEFNLQHAADGNVVLLPRNSTQPSTSTSSNENGLSHSTNGRRDKPKDESKKE